MPSEQRGGCRPGAGEGSPSVLVVEDDTPTRTLPGSILADEGITHQLAPSEQEALRVSAEVRPTMVLLDMQLPWVNGQEVGESLRSLFGPDLPILATSASLEEAAAEPCAYAFLPKPFEITNLVALVRHGLELSQRSHRLHRRSASALQRLAIAIEQQKATFDQHRGDRQADGERGHRGVG